jgi:Flp pilus assembly protein TadG
MKRWVFMFERRTISRDDSGQALIELALIVPIFTLLLVGAAEFGRLAYVSIEVADAARAGAAFGSQNHITASDTTNIVAAAKQDAPDVPVMTATTSDSCSCSDGTSITCATAGTSCVSNGARIIESVQVNTAATVDMGLHYPGLGSTFTLHGQAIMTVEQ